MNFIFGFCSNVIQLEHYMLLYKCVREEDKEINILGEYTFSMINIYRSTN